MKHLILQLLFAFVPIFIFAQDDLLKELEQKDQSNTHHVTSTFKGSRLVNGQTVETRGKGELEFIFSHRFGHQQWFYNLYGLDFAYVRLGLEYGITDRLGVGFGRNSFDKTMDFYTRYKILQQTVSNCGAVTISAFGYVAHQAIDNQFFLNASESDRLSYLGQILIARKFSTDLSLQLMPTFWHKNLVDKSIESNSSFALGAGGRYKISRSIALTSEYYYRFNVEDNNPYRNSIGFGVDIETGGHVFQLLLTNSQGITERAFITETQDDFFNGDIHLGFNVTRAFQLKTRK